jgi:hypothetical protein
LTTNQYGLRVFVTGVGLGINLEHREEINADPVETILSGYPLLSSVLLISEDIMNIKLGDIFEKPYPFTYYVDDFLVSGEHRTNEGWLAGCKKTPDGPYGESFSCECDGEGFIHYEVLAVVDMPRKYQQRVIYTLSMTLPDGRIKKQNKAHMATLAKFKEWISAPHSSYPYEYEVND